MTSGRDLVFWQPAELEQLPTPVRVVGLAEPAHVFIKQGRFASLLLDVVGEHDGLLTTKLLVQLLTGSGARAVSRFRSSPYWGRLCRVRQAVMTRSLEELMYERMVLDAAGRLFVAARPNRRVLMMPSGYEDRAGVCFSKQLLAGLEGRLLPKRSVFVYALLGPTGRALYVGHTADPVSRLDGHLSGTTKATAALAEVRGAAVRMLLLDCTVRAHASLIEGQYMGLLRELRQGLLRERMIDAEDALAAGQRLSLCSGMPYEVLLDAADRGSRQLPMPFRSFFGVEYGRLFDGQGADTEGLDDASGYRVRRARPHSLGARSPNWPTAPI